MPKLLKTSSDFKVNAMSADTDLEAVEALELCVLTGELEHIDSFLTEQELNLPRVAAMLRAIVNHMTQEKREQALIKGSLPRHEVPPHDKYDDIESSQIGGEAPKSNNDEEEEEVVEKESEADFEFELRRVHGESANPSMSMPSELFHSTVENVDEEVVSEPEMDFSKTMVLRRKLLPASPLMQRGDKLSLNIPPSDTAEDGDNEKSGESGNGRVGAEAVDEDFYDIQDYADIDYSEMHEEEEEGDADMSVEELLQKRLYLSPDAEAATRKRPPVKTLPPKGPSNQELAIKSSGKKPKHVALNAPPTALSGTGVVRRRSLVEAAAVEVVIKHSRAVANIPASKKRSTKSEGAKAKKPEVVVTRTSSEGVALLKPKVSRELEVRGSRNGELIKKKRGAVAVSGEQPLKLEDRISDTFLRKSLKVLGTMSADHKGKPSSSSTSMKLPRR